MTNVKVWSKFSAKRIKNNNEETLKFRIQDATEEMFEHILDFLEECYVPNELFHKAAGICKSKEAMKEYRQLWTKFGPTFNIVVCVLDDDTEPKNIIGVSAVTVETETDELEGVMEMVTTPEVKKLFDIMKGASEVCDSRKFLGVDKYYCGRGITVHPTYYGLGIAKEFVRTRRLITRANGIPATGAQMTAFGTQKAAEYDGWRTIAEMSFDELGKRCGVTFEGGPPICKWMVAEENLDEKK